MHPRRVMPHCSIQVLDEIKCRTEIEAVGHSSKGVAEIGTGIPHISRADVDIHKLTDLSPTLTFPYEAISSQSSIPKQTMNITFPTVFTPLRRTTPPHPSLPQHLTPSVGGDLDHHHTCLTPLNGKSHGCKSATSPSPTSSGVDERPSTPSLGARGSSE
jgi:hypothetical protein